MTKHASKTKILMVCLGNICRSPLAHGILEAKLPNTLFYVDSAGTANYHSGNTPDPRSIAIAKKNNIDISKQSARQFTVTDFDNFDIIYAMDSSNLKDILSLARTQTDTNKVKCILQENPAIANKNIPDPYYGGTSGFTNIFAMLNETCTIISKQLLK